jgi:CspA family cold shock protein
LTESVSHYPPSDARQLPRAVTAPAAARIVRRIAHSPREPNDDRGRAEQTESEGLLRSPIAALDRRLCCRRIARTVSSSPPWAATRRVVDPLSDGPCVCFLESGRRKGFSMATGKVKSVHAENGYGYIAAEDGKEYYFHRAGVKRPLDFENLFGGERVSFEIEANHEGPRAIEVTKA